MKTNWRKYYKDRVLDPQDALRPIRRGSRVFIGSGCGEPQLLVQTLMNMAQGLADTEIMHFLTTGKAPYTQERFTMVFRHNAFFVGANTREAIREGRADYTPIFLSEIPLLLQTGRIHIDTALISVSPPDRYGYVSLGVSVDVTKTAAENADYVVAEVNPNMPRTMGDSFLHVSRINAFVKTNDPILEFCIEDPGDVAKQIGKYIADLVEDGATVQVGYGSIPNAVTYYLKEKKDLGIHTETFTDGVIDLIKEGVITCRKKNLHPGKIIASFCMGSNKLYRFIDKNPLFEFHPAHYVNDPFVIAKNNKMISINAALNIDLTGQVCSDSLGYLFYSGIGGQVDFVRGAARSKGGKSIIALPSTTDDGKKSRIVPYLEEGSGVVLTRGDVHYVVTEYGIAYLHGKSIRERAMALINIAHPSYRSALLETAKIKGYVYKNQVIPSGAIYPKRHETYWTDGKDRPIFFRPIKLTDEKRVQDLVYSLPDNDLYKRFFSKIKSFPHEMAQPMVAIDYEDRMAIVGVVGKEGPGSREEIIAIGQYVRDKSTNIADVALTVHSNFQGCGIGTFLLWYMIQVAREHGITGFSAEVLKENDAIMKISKNCGYPLKATWAYAGVYRLLVRFDGEE
ncbi:MAG: GNAT family N-acetyltransferase [Thermodesulfobacteriota bacterium]|nr:GNAT family N-acetyltransferase [Thermodesulfobacteriota bacterium]